MILQNHCKEVSPVLGKEYAKADQMKSEVESEEVLKRLNTDCLSFLQRVALSEKE